MQSTELALSMFLWPPWALVAIIAAACILGGLAAWFLFFVVLRLPAAWTPHPPVFAGALVMFALILSFTVSDAWRRNETAYGALLRESQETVALLPVLDALRAAGQGQAGEVRQGVRDYIRLSLKEEWGAHNVLASAAAGAALDRARRAIATGLVEGGAAVAGWRTALDRLDGIQQGRTARLVAGGLFADALHWGSLYLLFLAGACALAVIHLDIRPAIRLAMPLYVLGSIVALSLAAVSEQPYTGWDAILPDRMMETLARFDG